MFDYIRKSFLFVFSICAISQSFAMEDDDIPKKKNKNKIKTIILQKFDEISDKYKKTKATEKLKKIVEIAEKNNFQEKDWIKIGKYVNKGADCNQIKIGKNQETLLIKAIDDQQNDLVYDLIDGGVDVNACDKDGYAPLHKMLMKRPEEFSIKIFSNLLKNKANTNANTIDCYEYNPLCLSIQQKHNFSTALLIDREADVNKADKVEFCTPLIYAIKNDNEKNDNFKIIQKLLSKGASLVNGDIISGKNAFHFIGLKPKEWIEDFIANAHFDFYNPKQDEMIRNALLSLERWSIGEGKSKIFLPAELQSHILKYLLSGSFFGEWEKIACIKIMKNGDRKTPLDVHVNRRREYLKTILQTPDKNGKTALDCLPSIAKEDIISLFDGRQLDDDNSDVVRKIRDNAQLLLKNK